MEKLNSQKKKPKKNQIAYGFELFSPKQSEKETFLYTVQSLVLRSTSFFKIKTSTLGVLKSG